MVKALLKVKIETTIKIKAPTQIQIQKSLLTKDNNPNNIKTHYNCKKTQKKKMQQKLAQRRPMARKIHAPLEAIHAPAGGPRMEERPTSSSSWGVGEHGGEARGRLKPSENRKSRF